MFEREKEFLIEVYLVDCDLVLQVSNPGSHSVIQGHLLIYTHCQQTFLLAEKTISTWPQISEDFVEDDFKS